MADDVESYSHLQGTEMDVKDHPDRNIPEPDTGPMRSRGNDMIRQRAYPGAQIDYGYVQGAFSRGLSKYDGK